MTAEVIRFMARETKPKSETFEHAGQKYTCMFDPNAPKGEQWVWYVDYIRTYRYVGNASTMDKAAANARRQIHKLNKYQIDWEENNE